MHQLADADNQNPNLDFLDRNGVPIADDNYDIDPEVSLDDPMDGSIRDEVPGADIVDEISGVNDNYITEDDNTPIGPPDHKTGRIPGVNMTEHGDAIGFK